MAPSPNRWRLARRASAGLVWEPDGGWLYSNDGDVIAGRIIEVISDMPYDEYMATHVLELLGIGLASFAPVRQVSARLHSGHALVWGEW